MAKSRVLFFGTPEIACPAFEALLKIAEVPAVICQPDRPVGRKQILQKPAVKVAAENAGIEVLQPTKVRTPEFAEKIRSYNADAALVMAYGRILVPAVLSAPRLGCINLHASLLPKYRGAAPIQWSIVKGEAETGITLMQMDEGLDTGAMLAKRSLPIGPNETAAELGERLARLAGEMVGDEFARHLQTPLAPEAQSDADASLAAILKREHGLLDFSQSAHGLHNHVRGFSPWPGTYCFIGEKKLKVLKTKLAGHQSPSGVAPGTVVQADKGGILVATGAGLLAVERAQLPGRKALDAAPLVAGRSLNEGDVLTSEPKPAP